MEGGGWDTGRGEDTAEAMAHEVHEVQPEFGHKIEAEEGWWWSEAFDPFIAGFELGHDILLRALGEGWCIDALKGH